jgi:hypothetical protein
MEGAELLQPTEVQHDIVPVELDLGHVQVCTRASRGGLPAPTRLLPRPDFCVRQVLGHGVLLV